MAHPYNLHGMYRHVEVVADMVTGYLLVDDVAFLNEWEGATWHPFVGCWYCKNIGVVRFNLNTSRLGDFFGQGELANPPSMVLEILNGKFYLMFQMW
jgi:hypothetical protein